MGCSFCGGSIEFGGYNANTPQYHLCDICSSFVDEIIGCSNKRKDPLNVIITYKNKKPKTFNSQAVQSFLHSVHFENIITEYETKKAEQEAIEAKKKQLNTISGHYEYEILSFNDGGGAAPKNAIKEALNRYAIQGWRVISSYSSELGKNSESAYGIGTNNTVVEHVFILERQVPN